MAISKKYLKVAMIVHSNFYGDARVRRYAETLAREGAKVDVICLPERDNMRTHPEPNLTLYPVSINRLRGSQINYLAEYGVSFVLYSFKLISLYLKNRYQVIHIHNMPDFLVFAALIPRLFGSRIILDIHDPMPELYMSKFGKKSDSLFVRLVLFQEKVSISFADAIITASDLFKVTIAERGIPKEKIFVVYNIPNTTIFDRKKFEHLRTAKHEYFTLIYPGTVAPRYGLDLPIRALPLLISDIPNIRLQIIGAVNKHTQELVSLAKDLDVSSYVLFEPHVKLDEVPIKMAKADVGIFTAIPDVYMRLIHPGKILEYIIMGLPIVAVRMPVIEELFGPSSILYYEPGNVEQFATCIRKLYQEKHLGEQLVNEVDTICTRNHIFDNVLNAYDRVLGKLLPPGKP